MEGISKSVLETVESSGIELFMWPVHSEVHMTGSGRSFTAYTFLKASRRPGMESPNCSASKVSCSAVSSRQVTCLPPHWPQLPFTTREAALAARTMLRDKCLDMCDVLKEANESKIPYTEDEVLKARLVQRPPLYTAAVEEGLPEALPQEAQVRSSGCCRACPDYCSCD